MNKLLFSLILIILIFGCSLNKLNSKEEFLSLSEDGEKVYIISSYPKNNSVDGIYLSALIVANVIKENDQVAAFINEIQSGSVKPVSGQYFNDSTLKLKQSTFPILIKSANQDSIQSTFNLSIERDEISFESFDKWTHSTNEFTICYPKSKSFKTDSIGTNYGIHRIEPMLAIIETINKEKVRQESYLSIHTIENIQELFRSTSEFYWVDFQFHDLGQYSLFLEVKKDKAVIVGYNSYIDSNESLDEIIQTQLNQNEFFLQIRFKNSENDFQIRSLNISLENQKKDTKFSVEPVKIVRNEKIVGNGIVYKL
jgi:hypothetical protein